jgi:iron complex outermembrane receptor protein
MPSYKTQVWISVLLFFCLTTNAQVVQQIKGQILNLHTRQPVSDMSIKTEDGKLGTISNSAGRFILKTPSPTKFVISGVGFHNILHAPIEDTLWHIIYVRPVYTNESEVMLIGSRGKPRSDYNSPVPVDVISSRELINTGQIDLAQMAQFTSPSFVSVKTGLNGIANYADPASLKGMSSDQTLVLINGKRRHQFASISNTLVPGRGSVVTDLNAIPALALERLEVLRDGAAAVYGSDAIAGVINLSLKTNHVGGLIKTDVGITHKGDGFTFSTSINQGLSLGKKGGYFNYTLAAISIQGTDRSDPYTGRFYNDDKRIDDSIRDARGVWPTNEPAQVMKFGSNETKGFQSFINFGLPLKNNWKWYGFGGTSNKRVVGESFFRTAKRNDPNGSALYPDGYHPLLPGVTADYSFFTGFERHTAQGWKIDLGTGYGYNHLDLYSIKSSNASMGLNSKKDFYVGRNSFAQSITEFDFSKTIKESGYVKWVNIAFGGQLRRDEYRLVEGEPLSYEIGPLAATENKVPGSSGRPGISPQDQTRQSRLNIATYFDIETDLHDKFVLSFASRYEHYSDFGGNISGKIAGLWKLNKHVALRSSINRGFRAPSLQQIYNGQTTSNAQNGLIRQTKQLPSNDPRLAEIGIPEPAPELSWNYNIGATLNINKVLVFTADVYQIDVENRIIISEVLQVGPSIPILQSVFPSSTGIKEIAFFTNHINTRTRGIDMVLSYKQDLTASSKLVVNAAWAYNQTKITKEKNPPEKLISDALVPIRLIDTISIGLITTAQPRQKIISSVEYTSNKTTLLVRLSHFGTVTAWEKPAGIPHRSQTFGAKTLTDFLMSYKFKSKIQLTFGVNNLFNVYPEKVNKNYASYTNGQVPYSRSGLQFGFNGSYYFTSIQIRI